MSARNENKKNMCSSVTHVTAGSYTVMSNYHLQSTVIGLRSMGLFSRILALPGCWDYSIDGLVAICKENKTVVRGALKRLLQLGYAEIIKLLPNETDDKKIGYRYRFNEYSEADPTVTLAPPMLF